MGDERRNKEYSSLLRRIYPKAEKILVIADGKGELARKLVNKGFKTHVVEAKPRFLGKEHPSITYEKGWFLWDEYDRTDFDLIVGMHPDQATGEIIRFGEKHKIPWSVVPCCVLGRDAELMCGYRNKGYNEWLEYLSKIDPCMRLMLKIQGKNIVLASQRKAR